VFVVVPERLKVQCMYAGNLVVFGHDVLRLSNLIRDVVLIGMNYCASILLYKFILSSEFSMA
jgi:hypothetical protein